MVLGGAPQSHGVWQAACVAAAEPVSPLPEWLPLGQPPRSSFWRDGPCVCLPLALVSAVGVVEGG